jgi:hypothetical protein
MRIRTLVLVAALCSATLGAALAQQSAATPTPIRKIPSTLSFTFDAPHGQLTASGFALNLAPKDTAVPNVTGTIDVTLTIHLVTRFHKETAFPCAATIVGGQIDSTNFVVEGGIETASGWATVKDSVVTCKLAIPYEWTIAPDPAAVNGLIIAFAAAGIGHEGNVVRSTTQANGFESIPADGSTTKFSFSAAL